MEVGVLAGSAEDGLGYAAIDLRLEVYEGNRCLLAADSAPAEVNALLEVPDLAEEDSVDSYGREQQETGTAIRRRWAVQLLKLSA